MLRLINPFCTINHLINILTYFSIPRYHVLDGLAVGRSLIPTDCDYKHIQNSHSAHRLCSYKLWNTANQLMFSIFSHHFVANSWQYVQECHLIQRHDHRGNQNTPDTLIASLTCPPGEPASLLFILGDEYLKGVVFSIILNRRIYLTWRMESFQQRIGVRCINWRYCISVDVVPLNKS